MRAAMKTDGAHREKTAERGSWINSMFLYRVYIFFSLCSLLLLSPITWAQGSTVITERFALLSAADKGGGDLQDLRYPKSDADKFARALTEMGGVFKKNLLRVDLNDAQTLREAFAQQQQAMRAARKRGRRVEFFFYYSGHADENGLRLGDDRMSYRELKQHIQSCPASLRLAILDACASGELTRNKGGQTRAAFLLDRSRDVDGLAIMTSSTAAEASQESDRLGGSFFTHYLINALRGAGDADGDSLVTMSEAYQYTYSHTLHRTQGTQSGPQHPSFAMDLLGAGEIVLSDLRSVDASLILDQDLSGNLYVLDDAGRVSAQIDKQADRQVELGLDPGDYDLALQHKGQLWLGQIRLRRRERKIVGLSHFSLSEREWTQARGASNTLSGLQYETVFWEFALWPGFGSNGDLGNFRTNHFSLTLLGGDGARLEGFGLSLLRNKTRQDLYGAQLALLGFNQVGNEVRGAQLGLLANWVGGDLLGLQLAIAANICRGQLYGLQISPLFNLLQASGKGMQVSNLVNLSLGHLDGVQISSALNVADHLRGLQLGLFNSAAQLRGVQVGSLANLVHEDLYGAQLIAPYNRARQLHGLQLGLINVSDKAGGAQLGLINIAGEISGVQMGLINLSDDMQGVPLGPISLAGNSPIQGELWIEDSQLFNLAIELGSPYGFNLFSAGLFRGQHAQGTWARRSARLGWSLGMGWGLRAPLGDDNAVALVAQSRYLWLDDWSVDSFELLNSLRFAWLYHLQPRFTLQLGLSLNMAITQDIDNAQLSPLPKWNLMQGDTQVSLWPGLFTGLVF